MNNPELKRIKTAINRSANSKLAKEMANYFKAHPGGYASYDCFLGIRMPTLRAIAKQHPTLDFTSLSTLLNSVYHEERMLALVILIKQYQSLRHGHKAYFDFYQQHITHINHWDLVDLSAPRVVGHYLQQRSKKPLYTWIKSPDPWQRRIAIVASHALIQQQQYQDTLSLVAQCLNDPVTLMHQACGWMLREVGKQDPNTLRSFINHHGADMPRTMLRYAIEQWPKTQRLQTLKTTRKPHAHTQ